MKPMSSGHMSGAKAISDGYFMLKIASESDASVHAFGSRNALTLNHLPVLLSQFKLAFYMTDL